MARINQVQYVNFYTAGSAAFKYEPTPLHKKKQATLPKMRRKKRILIHVDPVAILGVCMAVVLLIMMASGFAQLGEARRQEAQMAAYVTQLQQENVQLRTEYEAGYDLDEIRQLATAMGMVPAEQAERVQVHVNVPVEEEEPTAWENFCMFLTGLFA
jgi:hypothetical protein